MYVGWILMSLGKSLYAAAHHMLSSPSGIAARLHGILRVSALSISIF